MTDKKLNKILYMGCYGENFHRNVVVLNGLKKNSINSYEYNVNSHNIIKNIFLFLKNFKKLKKQNFDLVLLHSEVFIQFFIAKFISFIKKIPLVHDIFISKLQTIYYDRKQFKKRKLPKSLLWIVLFTMDLIECTFSDYLLIDAYSHIKFFHEKYKTPVKKFRKLLVGSMDDIFYPLEKKENDDKFIIGFLGTFIPLQGVEYIIKAAKKLENDKQIVFHFIGNGQNYQESRALASELKIRNISFFGFIPMKKVPNMISKFDINLGIFGHTNKALQVIPTKLFDGMAMKKAMISMDSPAIRELFTNNEDIVLCERSNPDSLAEAILKLKNDKYLRDKIEVNAYQLYKKFCSPEAIGKRLKKILKGILSK